MSLIRTLGGVALQATCITVPASAQSPAPLSYVQPLPPNAVQAVQQRLISAGAYNGAADGVWGPDSIAALQRFQASHQLQVTGQLNQATAATLGLDPGTPIGTQHAAVPPPLPPVETLRPASIRSLQSRLASLGFYTGSVDGVWGRSTENAVQRFQQGHDLQPNGQLNLATVSAMGLAPDALAYR